MPALGAPAQVKPPAPGGLALGAAGSAGRHGWVDSWQCAHAGSHPRRRRRSTGMVRTTIRLTMSWPQALMVGVRSGQPPATHGDHLAASSLCDGPRSGGAVRIPPGTPAETYRRGGPCGCRPPGSSSWCASTARERQSMGRSGCSAPSCPLALGDRAARLATRGRLGWDRFHSLSAASPNSTASHQPSEG
jgi:hypothetical protein